MIPFDNRRDIFSIDNSDEIIHFCIEHFIKIANEAILHHGNFYVALSGGSTPNKIYAGLAKEVERVDWSKVWLFWSDERAVPPHDKESNYFMAMQAGLSQLPIPKSQIHRMVAEEAVTLNAEAYEKIIKEVVPDCSFDLMMLGMGEDGHTASLFPHTKGLHVYDRLVIANFIPQKDVWRMTMTYTCINHAKNIVIYVIGKNKAEMLLKVLNSPFNPDLLPIQNVGTEKNKALYITDIQVK